MTVRIYEGRYEAKDKKFAIVVSRFNSFITDKLLDGALDALKRNNVADENIIVAKVPGAFEIPLMAKKMAESSDFDAVICLGAVIRGETTHYDLICNEVTKGIAQINLQTEKPVIYGLVTTENVEQAVNRAGTKSGNKGYDAAISALEMVNLVDQF